MCLQSFYKLSLVTDWYVALRFLFLWDFRILFHSSLFQQIDIMADHWAVCVCSCRLVVFRIYAWLCLEGGAMSLCVAAE